MKKRIVAVLLCMSMAMSMTTGCGSTAKTTDTKTKTETTSDADNEKEKSEQNSASAKAKNEADVDTATEEEVQGFMNDTDEKTVLVDSRAQESYAGWALEGAKNGGHLKNSALFSERWLDCDYSGSAPRTAYLERAMEAQNITKDSDIIVYDYDGEHAKDVASYFVEQGIKDVSIYQANDMIDAGTDLESYTNYDRFLPTEIVKSISDVKTGKSSELSEDAKAIIGDNMDKVVLIDVAWGNAKASSYFSAGHVPGAVHINTDSYERPRVYVPEKRSDYAKEWRLISLEEFRDSLCPQYGITKDSIVILTGTSSSPQGRLGFMLRSLGVKTYAMSGLLTAWQYNGYDLDTDESTLVIPTSVDSFGSDAIANPDEILWMDDIKAILSGEKEGQVADNRDEDEWNGEYSGYGYHDLAGKIEGSVWCSSGDEENGEYFTNIDGTARTQQELKAYMESNGLDTSKTVAFFCGDSWGAAKIAYWCQSVDLNNIKEWGNGWIPWSNEGNEFIDHNGNKVHYDKYLDTVLDENGKDVRDGVNILDDQKAE
ncbi:sulfurtransferase [Dorea formicigenerans]|uniref:sulfurtransferase n=1 Tax=Dorea formicigenerans TaxID=39486 RepID=UPI0036F2983D